MANVYMSFLGTNDYLPCTYRMNDGSQVGSTRFVQEATLKLACSGWSREDQGYVFVTDQAKQKNWYDDGHGKKLSVEGLRSRIATLKLPFSVLPVPIPEGNSEGELWDIFDAVFNCLKENDHVVFDITHAFRHIPMLASVLLNYARVIRKIRVSGIYYGAFETLGTRSEVEKKPEKERIAPIFDLSVFDTLQEWSFATSRFVDGGDASAIQQLVRQEVAPVFRSKDTHRKEAAIKLQEVAARTSDLAIEMATCRGRTISQTAARLKEKIEQYQSAADVRPFAPLFQIIKEEAERFHGEDVISDGIEAARWCAEHNFIQQGYTILQETMVSFLLLKARNLPFSEHPLNSDHCEQRDIVTSSLKIIAADLPEEEWKGPAMRHRELTGKVIGMIREYPDIRGLLDGIKEKRNDLMHYGMHENAIKKAEKFSLELTKLIEGFEKTRRSICD